MSRLSRVAAVAVLAVVLGAPPAWGGGDFVDLAVARGRAWFVGPFGIRSLDSRSGRVRSSPRLVGAAYPTSVAAAGGAAWVASVENGYVWGTLSRIDLRSGAVRVVWRKPKRSVQYVAAGAGSIWAVLGSTRGAWVARFSFGGRLLRMWRIREAGRMTADAFGCWISTGTWLVRIDPAGHVRRVLRSPLADVATGGGAVWLPRMASVLRLDERTGKVRVIRTGRLGLGGFQHDTAVGHGSLWALSAGRARSKLVRFDLHTGHRTGAVAVRGIADAVVVRPEAVWVATVLAPPGRSATGYTVTRFDPLTLRPMLKLTVD
jgi:hypothetical protein